MQPDRRLSARNPLPCRKPSPDGLGYRMVRTGRIGNTLNRADGLHIKPGASVPAEPVASPRKKRLPWGKGVGHEWH